MSFGRRNTDWQAWGQHRRRATARMAQKSREREIEEYQAQFEDKDGKGRLKTEETKMNEKDLIRMARRPWRADGHEKGRRRLCDCSACAGRDVEDCRGGNFGSGDNFMGGSVMFKFLRNRAKVEAILNKKGK